MLVGRIVDEVCDSCGNRSLEKKLSRCARCKIAKYCNKDCQSSAWPVHKTRCIDENPKPKKIKFKSEEERAGKKMMVPSELANAKEFILKDGRHITVVSSEEVPVLLEELPGQLLLYFPAHEFLDVLTIEDGPIGACIELSGWIDRCDYIIDMDLQQAVAFEEAVTNNVESKLKSLDRIYANSRLGMPEAINQWDLFIDDLVSLLAIGFTVRRRNIFATIPTRDNGITELANEQDCGAKSSNELADDFPSHTGHSFFVLSLLSYWTPLRLEKYRSTFQVFNEMAVRLQVFSFHDAKPHHVSVVGRSLWRRS